MVDKNRSFDSWRLFGLENAIVYKICFAFTASDITAPMSELCSLARVVDFKVFSS